MNAGGRTAAPTAMGGMMPGLMGMFGGK